MAAFEALAREDDQEVEIWYMLALSQGLAGDVNAAAECLSRAKAVSTNLDLSFLHGELLTLSDLSQLLDSRGDEIDASGQMRVQVLAAMRELQEIDKQQHVADATAEPMQQ